MNLLDEQLKNEIPEVIFTSRSMVFRFIQEYFHEQQHQKIDRIMELPTHNENEGMSHC